MKISINKSILLEKLDYINKGLSTKSPFPLLSGIKFDVSNENIILTSSNSDIAVQTIISVTEGISVLEPGSVVIPGKYFIEIIKKIDETQIDISVVNNLYINIKTKKSNFNLNGFIAKEYPVINFETNDQNKIFSVSQLELSKMINQTSYASSNSENRPILTGVNISIQDSKMTFTATDSFRLAKRVTKIDSNKEVNVTIPGKSLKDLSSLISEDETQIDVFQSNNYITFKINDVIFQSRLLEGNYPETSKLIPLEHGLKIKVNRYELIHAVERAVIVVTEGLKSHVKLVTDNKQITLHSDSTEIGNTDENINTLDFEGTDIKIAFSAKYIIDALRSLDTDNVELFFTGEVRPFIIKNENDNNNIQLILPVRTDF